MAIVDQLTKRDRLWHAHAHRCAETVMRAAGIQGRQHGIDSPIDAARELANLYYIPAKPRHWQEYGDVAFHLVATWPPDLAYAIVYALRELQSEIGHDPVPYVLKATEMMYDFRPEMVDLHLEAAPRTSDLVADPTARATAAAKLLARELSVVPLRWASGILHSMKPTAKKFVSQELQAFNPDGAAVLLGERYRWLLTGTGLVRWSTRCVMHVLFGKQGS